MNAIEITFDELERIEAATCSLGVGNPKARIVTVLILGKIRTCGVIAGRPVVFVSCRSPRSLKREEIVSAAINANEADGIEFPMSFCFVLSESDMQAVFGGMIIEKVRGEFERSRAYCHPSDVPETWRYQLRDELEIDEPATLLKIRLLAVDYKPDDSFCASGIIHNGNLPVAIGGEEANMWCGESR